MQPRKNHPLVAVIILLLLLPVGLWTTTLYADAPPLPFRVYGELPGIEAGATVSAQVGGTEFATSTSFTDAGRTVYVIDVPGDDPSTPDIEGASDGAAITFQIAGIDAEETVNWAAGTVLATDLHRAPSPGGPVAQDQALNSLEDVPVAIVLEASDPDFQPLTYQIVGGAQNGVLTGAPPTVTYTPNDDWNGVDSFTFEASDGTDTDLGTVTLTVEPVPDPPRFESMANQTMTAGSSLSVPVVAIDPDGHVITLTAENLPTFAALNVTGNGVGELVFNPGLNDAGTYGSLRLVATDGNFTDHELLTLVVSPLSGPPIASDGQVSTPEDVQVGFTLEAIDPDGDAITFQVETGPENGTLEGTAPQLTYVPNADFFGTDQLTFTASDGAETSTPATVTFTVDPVEDAPRLATLDDLTINEGEVVALTIEAFEPDGDAVTLTAANLPPFAGFTDHGDGTGTLDLLPGFGDDGTYPGLEFTASDGGLTDTQSFTVTVTDYQAPPTARFRPAKGMNVALLGSSAIESYSSHLSVNGPERAIDHLPQTAWRSASNADEWLRLDLAGDIPHVLDRIVLQGSSQITGVRQFEFRVSTSNGTADDFVTVLSGEVPQDIENHTFSFAPVEARRIELRLIDNWGYATATDVRHFEVWTRDTAGGIVSLVAGGASVAEFSSERQDPERAFDLSDSTRWESANGQITNQWLTVELIGTDPHRVDRVRLVGPSIASSPRDFEIRVSSLSSQAADMITVYQGTLPSGGQPHWFFFEPVEARYVQLFVHDTHGDIGWVGVASFDVYSPSLGSPTVLFDDHSFDPDGTIVSWSWDFGDGNTSTERHPAHTYAAPGPYTVALTVTDDQGQSTVLEQDYNALHLPQVAFDWTPQPLVEGDFTRFADLSTDADGLIVGWRWIFHDGAERTADDPTWIYRDNGVWPVTLEVTDSQLLTASATLDVAVENAAPGLVVIPPSTSVVWGHPWEPDQASATDPGADDQAALVCEWNYGDGNIVEIQACYGTDARVEHTYATPGTYTATLTVTDPNGATDVESFDVEVERRASRASILDQTNDAVAQEVLVPVRLTDEFDLDQPLAGRTLTVRRGAQAVDVVTDAAGEATAILTLVPGDPDPVVVDFAGDTFYLPDTGTALANGVVLAGVSEGQVLVYDATGELIEVLDTTSHSLEQAGMCFDPDGLLLTTNFLTIVNGNLSNTYGSMSRFDRWGNRLDALWTDTFPQSHPESCTIDAAGGRVYVGSVDGGPGVPMLRQYDLSGQLLATFEPELEDRGIDWIDLAADRCTLFYTSEGHRVLRFDVCTGQQLPDFATGLADPLYALRIRGNGEVMVASNDHIYRLSPTGEVMQTYLTNGGNYFGLNLDPDGTSFWTGVYSTGRIFRVDIETGDVLTEWQVPITRFLSGLAVVGELTAASNRLPVADAGPDQLAETGDTVTLDGSASSDPDGDLLAFSWTQLSGPAVTLSGFETVAPTFSPADAGVYVFELSVSDGSESALDTVSIDVQPGNDAPLANAGVDQLAIVGGSVTLDGSASSDPDGDALTFAWTQLGGPAATLTGADSAAPSFVPVEVGLYVFELSVSDGTETATDSVSIDVQPGTSCHVFPFAMDWTTFNNVAIGWQEVQVPLGTTPGHFNWLSWTGAADSASLATSLTPPGNSHTYVHPADPSDTDLSTGDWVYVVGDRADEPSLHDALDLLVGLPEGSDIVVPIWTQYYDGDGYQKFQIGAFVGVRVVSYDLNGTDTLTLNYLGEVSCPAP